MTMLIPCLKSWSRHINPKVEAYEIADVEVILIYKNSSYVI